MSSPGHITILGGGPAGLAVAYYARKRGLPFLLLEGNARVGGNCVTFRHGDFLYDSGAHRFHDVHPEVTREIQSVMGADLEVVSAPSQIYLAGQMIDFPLAPWNLIQRLDWRTLMRGARDLLHSRVFGSGLDAGASFEEVVCSRYGRTIADLFLLKYSEKLWGLPGSSLSSAVSGRRLEGLNLRTFAVEMLRGPKRKQQHLDGKFFYPRHGYGTISDKLAAAAGIENIQTETLVTRIFHDSGRIVAIELNREKQFEVQELVSTLPLKVFLMLLDPAPSPALMEQAHRLRFRHLILVALFLEQASVTANASVYFPEAHIPFTRISEPRNRSAQLAPPGKTSLVVEMCCDPEDELWRASDQRLLGEVVSKLEPMGWIKPGRLSGTEVRKIPFAYPVLAMDSENTLRVLNDYLARFENLELAGRNSLFSYTHLHDQMKAGRELIEGYGDSEPT